METAFWLDWSDLKKKDIPAGRLYLGDENCENRLPAAEEILLTIRRLMAEDRQITLVTPWVTEKGLAFLSGLFEKLAGEGKPLEVVCNDWGVLLTLERHPFITPLVGRLLNHQSCDPRLARLSDAGYQKHFEKDIIHLDGTKARLLYQPPSPALMNHIRSSSLSQADVFKYLSGMGLKRLEMSNLLQGLEVTLPHDWFASLYSPRVIVAVRRCRLNPCCYQCRESIQKIIDPGFPTPLYLTPKEVYYQNPVTNPAGLPSNIDRIVYQMDTI